MYIHDRTEHRCSQCGCTSCESVQQGNEHWLRCTGCGHCGERIEIIPQRLNDVLRRYAQESRERTVREF